MLKTMRDNSIWVIKNSGTPVISRLKIIYKRKILFFYLNLNIFNIKIKRFYVKNKQDFNRITADCASQKIARATQTRRYGFHFG